MSTIERPGINSKWLKRMKTWHRGRMTDWWENILPDVTRYLEYYAGHGFIPDLYDFKTGTLLSLEQVTLPSETHMGWTKNLANKLTMYTYLRLFEFERLGTMGAGGTVLATHIFSAFYIAEAIRFSGNSLSLNDTPFAALGIILDSGERSFTLARQRIAYFRELLKNEATEECYDLLGVIRLKAQAPIFHFMLRLLADYLNEPPHLLVGKALDEPIFVALLKLWRDPDPEALVPACLAACDFHTHRCWDEFQEFAMDHWVYIPIEILLLFKLRQLLGLQNPTLDHPIMNSPLGVLPEEVRCEPDDLIRRVRERMIQDGYDETKILARYETNTNARMPSL